MNVSAWYLRPIMDDSLSKPGDRNDKIGVLQFAGSGVVAITLVG